MGLSEQDIDDLLADNLALAYDNMHADWAQFVVFAAVEQIVARQIAAALNLAADAIENDVAHHPPRAAGRVAGQRAARLVRTLSTAAAP